MTYSSVWFDWFIMGHDLFICVIWLIHTCDMTHSYVWYDSFIRVTWLIHMCDMTRSHEQQIHYGTWLIRECDTTHSYVLHDCVLPWLSCIGCSVLQCMLQCVLQCMLQCVLQCMLQLYSPSPPNKGSCTMCYIVCWQCAAVCVAVCVAVCLALCVALCVGSALQCLFAVCVCLQKMFFCSVFRTICCRVRCSVRCPIYVLTPLANGFCTSYYIWSGISPISKLNRWSKFLGLFCHVPLCGDALSAAPLWSKVSVP